MRNVNGAVLSRPIFKIYFIIMLILGVIMPYACIREATKDIVVVIFQKV